MKKITCKNCGAVFNDDLEKCPYCGTMNKKGAYRNFRQKVSAVIDQMLGLKGETHRSISKGIFLSLIRSLIIVAVVILAAYLFSRTMNVNYYNDKEYDEQALKQIVWIDENLDKLNEAYENEDFDTIEKLYYENTSAVSQWTYFPIYSLKDEYKNIMEYPFFNESLLQKVLYFLFYPDYYAGYNRMTKEFEEEYQLLRESVLTFMNTRGYTEASLEEIYRKCCDSYGYVSSSDLKEYVKEADNG